MQSDAEIRADLARAHQCHFALFRHKADVDLSHVKFQPSTQGNRDTDEALGGGSSHSG
jgi:hypothetical protein|tara:strand:+ start:693 stop:866 length:174 start_codon:yes stop_codon:yes gene_type:complete